LPRLGRYGKVSASLPVAIDAVAGQGHRDRIEVAPTEAFDDVQLIGEPVEPIGQTVGEASRAETAIAAGCGVADTVGLQEDHVQVRMALLGEQCRPQPGVAAADDDEIRIS
jgi:hypothetical protein